MKAACVSNHTMQLQQRKLHITEPTKHTTTSTISAVVVEPLQPPLPQLLRTQLLLLLLTTAAVANTTTNTQLLLLHLTNTSPSTTTPTPTEPLPLLVLQTLSSSSRNAPLLLGLQALLSRRSRHRC